MLGFFVATAPIIIFLIGTRIVGRNEERRQRAYRRQQMLKDFPEKSAEWHAQYWDS